LFKLYSSFLLTLQNQHTVVSALEDNVNVELVGGLRQLCSFSIYRVLPTPCHCPEEKESQMCVQWGCILLCKSDGAHLE